MNLKKNNKKQRSQKQLIRKKQNPKLKTARVLNKIYHCLYGYFGPQGWWPAETPFERHRVGCPSVIKVGGTFYMYYEAPCEYVVTRDGDAAPHLHRRDRELA